MGRRPAPVNEPAVRTTALTRRFGKLVAVDAVDLAVRRGGIFGLLAMTILAPLAAMLIQMAISRSREFEADATGARMIHNPLALASALEKLEMANQQHPMPASPQTAHLFIVNPLRGASLARLFSTHPPLEERIQRLRSMTAV